MAGSLWGAEATMGRPASEAQTISDEKATYEEGCLSLPDQFADSATMPATAP